MRDVKSQDLLWNKISCKDFVQSVSQAPLTYIQHQAQTTKGTKDPLDVTHATKGKSPHDSPLIKQKPSSFQCNYAPNWLNTRCKNGQCTRSYVLAMSSLKANIVFLLIPNHSSGHKTTLIRRDQTRHKLLQSFIHQFRHNLIRSVAQAERPEISPIEPLRHQQTSPYPPWFDSLKVASKNSITAILISFGCVSKRSPNRIDLTRGFALFLQTKEWK